MQDVFGEGRVLAGQSGFASLASPPAVMSRKQHNTGSPT